MNRPIEELPNLGPTSARWLRSVGIDTIEELKRLGPLLAYRLVKQQQPRASLNLLWAMIAGISDRNWQSLSAAEKAEYQQQLAADNGSSGD